MAHAGEEVILRLIQFLDLFFLLPGELVLLFIEAGQKQQQHTGQGPHDDDGGGGIQERPSQGVLRDIFREVKGGIVAQQGLACAEQEKHDFPLSHQDNADVNEAEHEPFRHAAIKSPCREKAHREEQEQQHRNGGPPCIDTALFDADLHDECHNHKACKQEEKISNPSAHGKYKNQRDHTDARDQTKHTFPQADFMVVNAFEQSFYHPMVPSIPVQKI